MEKRVVAIAPGSCGGRRSIRRHADRSSLVRGSGFDQDERRHAMSALEQLLDESPAAADRRARGALAELAGAADGRYVLVGAGGLGRRTLAGLRALGRPPLAFADNFKAGQVDGVPVLSLTEAVERHGDDAVFLITIWGAGSSHRHAHTRERLCGLGARHVASFGLLYWKHAETFLPYYALDLPGRSLEHADAIRSAYELWSDEASRAQFLAQLRLRLHLDFDGLPAPTPDPYFPPDVLALRPGEVFVDGGAFDGDTLVPFVERCPDFGAVLAIEPDATNAARLRARLADWNGVRERVEVQVAALGSRAGTARLASTGTMSSRTSAAPGADGIEIPVHTLDALCRDRRPTFVKLDIEGAELEALAGARETIARARPVLAVCTYHCHDHLWRVPLTIASLRGADRYALRAHHEEGWDVVCYAVPEER